MTDAEKWSHQPVLLTETLAALAITPGGRYVDGAFGLKGLYVGVPTIIGAGGIERVVDIKMTADEQAMIDKSVTAVKGLVEACKAIDPSLA